MKVFAISDLHLSTTSDKPMEIFGKEWDNYIEKISMDWQEKVSDDDIVLIAGDISWAMTVENAKKDLEVISGWKGHKVLLKGNHDYWWHSLNKVKSILPEKTSVIQNNVIRFEDVLVCGSRGWLNEEGNVLTPQDKAIYEREVIRMELSLSEMQKIRKPEDKVVAMIHYPPFTARFEPTKFTELFVKYNVDSVVYGHLHGTDCRAEHLVQKFGINFHLTSCDLVKNKLTQIF